MAKLAGYKVDKKKKVIYRYEKAELTADEKENITLLIQGGYELSTRRIKRPPTVEEMREALSADKEALKKFEELYKMKKHINEKGKEEAGFHAAAKFYTEWKKAQKK